MPSFFVQVNIMPAARRIFAILGLSVRRILRATRQHLSWPPAVARFEWTEQTRQAMADQRVVSYVGMQLVEARRGAVAWGPTRTITRVGAAGVVVQ